MPAAKVAPVKNGKPAAKAPVESSSEEEDSDNESEEAMKVPLIATFSTSRRCIGGSQSLPVGTCYSLVALLFPFRKHNLI